MVHLCMIYLGLIVWLVDYLTLKALRHFLELEQNQVFLGGWAGAGKTRRPPQN